jgi:hypothetical protein
MIVKINNVDLCFFNENCLVVSNNFATHTS